MMAKPFKNVCLQWQWKTLLPIATLATKSLMYFSSHPGSYFKTVNLKILERLVRMLAAHSGTLHQKPSGCLLEIYILKYCPFSSVVLSFLWLVKVFFKYNRYSLGTNIGTSNYCISNRAWDTGLPLMFNIFKTFII